MKKPAPEKKLVMTFVGWADGSAEFKVAEVVGKAARTVNTVSLGFERVSQLVNDPDGTIIAGKGQLTLTSANRRALQRALNEKPKTGEGGPG